MWRFTYDPEQTVIVKFAIVVVSKCTTVRLDNRKGRDIGRILSEWGWQLGSEVAHGEVVCFCNDAQVKAQFRQLAYVLRKSEAWGAIQLWLTRQILLLDIVHCHLNSKVCFSLFVSTYILESAMSDDGVARSLLVGWCLESRAVSLFFFFLTRARVLAWTSA